MGMAVPGSQITDVVHRDGNAAEPRISHVPLLPPFCLCLTGVCTSSGFQTVDRITLQRCYKSKEESAVLKMNVNKQDDIF